MHHHVEVLLPPTPIDEVEDLLETVMAPFDEEWKDENGDRNCHAFWDYYLIGGAWKDAKRDAMEQHAPKEALKAELAGKPAGHFDICPLRLVPEAMSCYRFLAFMPSRVEGEDDPYPFFMIAQEQWNGVIHVKADWDATVGSAIDMLCERHRLYYREELAKAQLNDYLLVTVDCHS